MRFFALPALLLLGMLTGSPGLEAQQPRPEAADPSRIVSHQLSSRSGGVSRPLPAPPQAGIPSAAAVPHLAAPPAPLPIATGRISQLGSNAPAQVPQAAVIQGDDQLEVISANQSGASGILPDVNVAYPESITLNVPAGLIIRLSTGSTAVTSNARLTVTLPEHLELVDSVPQPEVTEENQLVFDVPELNSANPLEIRMEVLAKEKRPVSVQTRLELVRERQIELAVRQPVLELQLEGNSEGVLGQAKQMELVVRNTGDGEARELNIDLKLPAGCVADEKLLEQLVNAGTLAPGEEARFQVETRLVTDGEQRVTAVARALGAESPEGELGLNVIRPQLEIAVSAPEQTWVNSRSWYALSVTNPTTIEIADAVVTIRVPSMVIQTISTEAAYNEADQTLTWRIGTLAPGEKTDFQMVAIANEAGPHLITASLESNLTERKELAIDTVAQTRANLAVAVSQLELPAPVGVSSGYKVTVENSGTEVAEGVEVCVQLPKDWVAEDSESCVFENQSANFVIDSIGPGERRELTFQATGNTVGENLLRATVRHGDSRQASMSENSMLLFQTDSRRVAETAEPRLIR